ncbi:hypothetical protein [Streptomyces sp. A1-5]|uniref:hypothetical protein n=1 Tax=Streptomyces sp. A1-5 TaxID=2738410 RepID=UPI001F340714|nr:hypothetical protein [Streptomyces sp. A1-5]UJB43041.1 hypothetical protein HRD51_21375 [Streptomyces sp. A1-5]
MTSPIVFREPLYTTQFSPLQLRPRALLDLASNGLARCLAEHLVPISELVHQHDTAIVVRTVHLDYLAPDLRFADASWLGIRAQMTASETGEWLGVTVDYRAGHRPAARARLILRVLTVADPDSLAAQPGRLPDYLLVRFPTDQRRPHDEFRDRARIEQPFETGPELLVPQEWETTLTRSHCEVADQWSFFEMVELAATARERLFDIPDLPADARHQAVGAPVRRIIASFQRPMFVFDRCRTLTRAHRTSTGNDAVFEHAIHAATGDKPHLRVWELLDAV